MNRKIGIILVYTAFIGMIFSFPALEFADDAFAGILIVTNKGVGRSELTKDEIRRIFTGKMFRWSDGAKINVVILRRDSEVHKEFVKTYTGKSSSQFERWWRNIAFTGKGSIPKSFRTEKELLDYIIKTDGSIGYVSMENRNVEVNIINN